MIVHNISSKINVLTSQISRVYVRRKTKMFRPGQACVGRGTTRTRKRIQGITIHVFVDD